MRPQPLYKYLTVAPLFAVTAWVATIFVLSAQPALGRALPPSDGKMENAILNLFDDDPVLDSTTIGVDVVQGVAALEGLARDLRDKDRAERLTSRIRGVRAIINSIELPPIKRNDSAIAADVRAALSSEPVTQDVDLTVVARGGKIGLAGRVDSLTQRKGAYLIASGVRGVFGVDIDKITIVPANARPDAELQRAISARLAWNVWTADSDITVDVDSGIARIHGSVASLWLRDLSVDLASIPGIADVDTTKIDINPGSAAPMERSRPSAYTDQEIAEAIDRALLYDFEVLSFDIDIDVDAGVVRLSGTVPTLAQRDKAARIASNTIGVRNVRNEIAIRTKDAPTDKRLVELVKHRLARAPAFVDNPPIGVVAQAGVITLLGTVENLYDKRRAEELVKHEVGVTGVINKLRLSHRS